MIDKQSAVRTIAGVISDTTLLMPVHIRIREAWLIIAALQMATRHPDLSPEVCQTLEQIGRQFQDAVTARHPKAQELLEMGWNPDFDVLREEDER